MTSARSFHSASRHATPEQSKSAERATVEIKGGSQVFQHDVGQDWVEPALRPPAPSFEDHRGLERQGVLEHMAPLGTTPTQKLKLRVKQYDPTRRMSSGKSGDSHIIRGGSKIREDSSASRRPQSRPPTGATDKDADHALMPNFQENKTAPVSMATPIRKSATPTAKSVTGQERLRHVVDSAVDRARTLGNESLGLAIHQLYEESLQNRTLADLLDAVLSQEPSKRQADDFQAYIKSARKRIRLRNKSVNYSSFGSTQATESPTRSSFKTARRSLSRSIARRSDDAAMGRASAMNQHSSNGDGPDEDLQVDEPPAKRAKRSGSASSTSSLSSTHSMDLEGANDRPFPDGPTSAQLVPRARSGLGLRPHNNLIRLTTGGKRSVATAPAPGGKNEKGNASLTELAARKRKLQKTYDDYKIEPSNVRRAPVPTKRERFAVRYNATPEATNASRVLRSEEFEKDQSPVSSVLGDFLVPPPPGALRISRSRGATPNNLVRPQNAAKRSARIKMS